jgi:hypothetical protein
MTIPYLVHHNLNLRSQYPAYYTIHSSTFHMPVVIHTGRDGLAYALLVMNTAKDGTEMTRVSLKSTTTYCNPCGVR